MTRQKPRQPVVGSYQQASLKQSRWLAMSLTVSWALSTLRLLPRKEL